MTESSLCFKIFFKEVTFPDKLKLSRTDPVFKRGDSSGVSWYKARTISSVHVLAKVLKTIMNRQLMWYFERTQ